MHIILEGPDNAGKSTLADKLCQGQSVRYWHPGGKPKDREDELRHCEQQLAMMRSRDWTIFDRITPVSQQVYNPDNEMQVARRDYLEMMLREQAVLIYCRPSTDRLLRLQDTQWKPYDTEEHKQKIIQGQHMFVELYDALMQTVPCVSFDFEDATASVIVRMGRRALQHEASSVEWFKNIINFRG